MADDQPILFTKRLGALVPANSAAERVLDGFDVGKQVRVKVSRPRIHAHLAKWWVLCTRVAEAIGPSVTAELISDTLKVRSGHVQIVKTKRGELQFPKSIAFDKLSQEEFSALYERALVIITQDFLPGVPPSALRDDIERLAA